MFSGRGAPAFMSTKEPALRLLKEKYGESFAFTLGARSKQVHLFLIKLGLWSLVLTLTPRDTQYLGKNEDGIGLEDGLCAVEDALAGKNAELAARLDTAVMKSLERIRSKVQEFQR